MIVRALDSNGDWTFGASLNNYLSAKAAVAQMIKTNVSSFLGDCFFDLGFGIDWFTFLSSKNDQLALNLAISAVILNTENVTGILQVSSTLDRENRSFSVVYRAQTTYSVLSNTFSLDLGG